MGMSTNEMWQKIKGLIDTAVDKFIPVTKQGNQKTKKWMDKNTLETVRKKKRLWRLWKKTKKEADFQKYLQANNKASRACKKAQRRLEKDVAEKAKTDPKAFWSYVNGKTKAKSGVADLKKSDGTRTSSDKEKAEILNTFFQSVFTVENNDIPDPPSYNFNEKLSDFSITEDKVKKTSQRTPSRQGCRS